MALLFHLISAHSTVEFELGDGSIVLKDLQVAVYGFFADVGDFFSDLVVYLIGRGMRSCISQTFRIAVLCLVSL
jgi:hypothetical protein